MDFDDIYELINNHGIKALELISSNIIETNNTEGIEALFDILKMNTKGMSSTALEILRQIFEVNKSLFNSFEDDLMLLK